jgi:hypothetical protein
MLFYTDGSLRELWDGAPHFVELAALLATHFVDGKALYGVHRSKPSVVAPPELFTVTSRYAESMIFYMDGSLIDEYVGFTIHLTEEGDFGL